VAGFIYMIFPGAIYIAGNIQPYVSNYYDVPLSRTTNILLTSIIGQMFTVPLGSYLVQQGTDPKLLIFIGAAVFFTLQMLAASATTYEGFFWAYTSSWSINHGLCYMIPIHHSWLWFPASPGLVSGLVIAGFGFGSLIFNMLST